MHSLKITTPILPDDQQIVIVELEDGSHTMAKYTARVWKNFNSLQGSFKPVGVKKQWNEDGNDIIFTHDVVSWKSYKQGEI